MLAGVYTNYAIYSTSVQPTRGHKMGNEKAAGGRGRQRTKSPSYRDPTPGRQK